MDRRTMMMLTGIAALGAALPPTTAMAEPPPPDVATPGAYLFADEFDGPLGSGVDPSKWIVQTWDDDVTPPLLGHYRDDRRNLFQDGNSNLVLRATREGSEYFSGRIMSQFRGQVGTTWEARIKLDCMTPGNWPAFWLLNQDPLPDGEVDIVEWYGNLQWPSGTTVHAASNGKTWKGRPINELVDNNWHTWRVHWGIEGFQFWRDYTPGAKPYYVADNKPIPVHDRPEDLRWPFGIPGYWMQAILNLAVGGPGGGDPSGGTFPSTMLVDYIRVW